jgi:UDP:flavonoid glycosyltransferase YjiC (YdhE family)
MYRKSLSLLVLAASVACGGDSAKSASETEAAVPSTPIADFKKQQEHFADSVLNSASSAKDIAKKLGDKYDVGSTRMRDSLAVLAAKSPCFAVGQRVDPYLAGTVTFWVNMSRIGTDVIRVQEATWTSPAGKYVEACLNQEAKKWSFDNSFALPKAYLVQAQFKPVASSPSAASPTPPPTKKP